MVMVNKIILSLGIISILSFSIIGINQANATQPRTVILSSTLNGQPYTNDVVYHVLTPLTGGQYTDAQWALEAVNGSLKYTFSVPSYWGNITSPLSISCRTATSGFSVPVDYSFNNAGKIIATCALAYP